MKNPCFTRLLLASLLASASAFASPFSPNPSTELVVYSSAKSSEPLHVETIGTNALERPTRWDFPPSYTGHRAVCKLDGASSNDAFKAWIGGDQYKPANPFGVKLGDDNVIELSVTHPIFARVPFAYKNGMSDREIAFGGTYTTSGTNKLGQAIMHYGSSDVEVNPNYAGDISALLNTRVTRIRVKRARVDGQQATQGSLNHRVIYDKYVPTDIRSFICEYDVIGANEFDIDWAHFDEIRNDENVGPWGLPITQVVYRVCIGEGDFNINTKTNAEPWIEVSRRFGKNHVRPSDLSVETGGARPVFLWRMDEGLNPQYNDTYTAFRLTVSGSSSFDTGMKFRPPRDKDGRFRYTCFQSLPSGSYTWNVSMYNSKFQTNAWSTATFTIP